MSEEIKSGTKRKPSGNQWVRRSTCFQTSEVDKEKNFTSLSRNLSKVAPHVLAPILNVQTSHFVKVLFVISFSQSRDGGIFVLNVRCFFRAFLSRSRKTTKMDWKTWNFVSMYLRRSWDVHSPMSEELKSGTKREPNGYLWIRGSTCFQTPEVDR